MPGDRPILFRDDMVRAILEGRKTVTRRVGPTWAKVEPGTRLWVREAWNVGGWTGGEGPRVWLEEWPSIPKTRPEDCEVIYRADGIPAMADVPRYRPSIHMPRWASRLTLEVVSVTEEVTSTWSAGSAPGAAWVSSMPSVDDDEARREGLGSRAEFLAAWRSMHADHTGPVYRVEFRKLEVPDAG